MKKIKNLKTKDGFEIQNVKTIYYINNNYKIIEINLEKEKEKQLFYKFERIGEYQTYLIGVHHWSYLLLSYLNNNLTDNLDKEIWYMYDNIKYLTIEKTIKRIANFFYADFEKILKIQQKQKETYLKALAKVSDLIEYLKTLPSNEIVQFNNEDCEYGDYLKTFQKTELREYIKSTKNPLYRI